MIRRVLLIGPKGSGKRSFVAIVCKHKNRFENYEICLDMASTGFDYVIIMIDGTLAVPDINKYIEIAKQHVVLSDIVLCINKVDLGRQIKPADIRQFGLEYYYTSAKTRYNCVAVMDHFMILRERLYAQMTFINYTNIVVEE